MPDRVHRWAGRTLWRLLLVAVVILALYVSLSRLLLSQLPVYRQPLLDELHRLSGVRLEVASIRGELDRFAPAIQLDTVALHYVDGTGSEQVIRLDSAQLRLDPWESLLGLRPAFHHVELAGLQLSVAVESGGDPVSVDIDYLRSLLRAYRRVRIIDGEVTLTTDTTELGLTLNGDYRRSGSERELAAQLITERGSMITLQGSGVGDPLTPRAFSGELSGVIQSDGFQYVADVLGEPLSGSGQLGFWYEVRQGVPTLTLDLALDSLRYAPSDAAAIGLDEVRLQALLAETDTGWKAFLDDVSLVAGGDRWQSGRIAVESEGASYHIQIADTAVDSMGAVLVASGALVGKAREVVEALAPSGRITAGEFRIADRSDPLVSWSASAEVSDATISPYDGVPGLVGIDAFLEGSERGATAWFETRDFQLDLPRLYRQPLAMDAVTGRLSVRWDDEVVYLHDGLLHAVLADHSAIAQFGIDIPIDEDRGPPTSLKLNIALEDAPAAVRGNYIPYKIKPDLDAWLSNAIVSGRIEEGVFVWRGETDDWGAPTHSTQLGLRLRDTELKFQPEWPPLHDLSALVLLDTRRVSVWGGGASLMTAWAEDASVEIDTAGDRVDFALQTKVRDALPGAMAVLLASPLADRVVGLTDSASFTGNTAVDLSLAMDLNDAEESVVASARIAISDGGMQLTGIDLAIDAINGELGYDSTAGFTGRDLSATLFGAPLSIDIRPDATALVEAPVFAGVFSGRFPARAVGDWGGLPTGVGLDGASAVAVEVAAAETTRIRVTSDLVGTALDLPAPIGKVADVPAPLVLDIGTDADAPFDIFWHERLTGRLYQRDGAIAGGAFDLTPRGRRTPIEDPPLTEGLFVKGAIPYIHVEDWLAVARLFDRDVSGGYPSLPVTIREARVDSLELGGADIGPITVDLAPYEDWDMLGINAGWIDAELTLMRNDEPSSLIINNLNLDALPAFSGDGASPQPPELGAPLNVVVANLQREGRQLGAARFTLRSEAGELRADDIRGQLADIGFDEGSRLVWRGDGETGFETALTLNTRFRDIGRTLEELGLERSVETRSGQIRADLRWPGGPPSVTTESIRGDVAVQLRDGAFLPAPSGATGLLRIISILNLADLLGRANITRIFDAGVTFTKAEGDLVFDGGQLGIPGFTINGTGGRFAFDSDIDLVQSTIDGELIVTLPVVNNIPWVVALFGGLPVAAGAFVVSKILENQVDALASTSYSVKGDLDNPQVKFLRVFDATGDRGRERKANSPEPAPGDASIPPAVPPADDAGGTPPKPAPDAGAGENAVQASGSDASSSLR